MKKRVRYFNIIGEFIYISLGYSKCSCQTSYSLLRKIERKKNQFLKVLLQKSLNLSEREHI